MRNLEGFDALWRDNPMRLCAYALLLALLLIILQYHLIINPRNQTINALTYSLDNVIAQTVPRAIMPESNMPCAWEKTQPAWVLSGSFAYVYDCLLHSVPNHQEVISVQIKKHVHGISAVLRFYPENQQ